MLSGVITLFSVISPGLPERREILLRVVPMEFLHLSRFLSLLIGFGLVVSSINIYKRKIRAMYVVSALATLSVVFHLTKALDYEEALVSFFLLAILFFTRKWYTVKSDYPDPHALYMRLGVGAVFAIVYGIAGFWFLDPREFGINFSIGESISNTIQFLTFQGDPMIVPRTMFATWFIESLYLISLTVIAYTFITLYKPVIYRFRTHPHELQQAKEIVEHHGRASLDYFKFWPDKALFFSDSRKSVIAYKVGGSFAMVLGDPVGLEEETGQIISTFMEYCRRNDWGFGFYQTLPDFLPVYDNLGLNKMKIGDEAIIELQGFFGEGGKSKNLRNRVNHLEKEGIRMIWHDPPVPEGIISEAKEVSDEWLKLPGHHESVFSLGTFDRDYIRSTSFAAAVDETGKMLAFMNLIPSYRPGKATVDLMRHRPDGPNGLMDFLFVTVAHALKEKGFTLFSLGLAPMSDFQEDEDVTLEERSVHYFFQHLNFKFNFIGLNNYKKKFATSWEPRYLVYRNILELPSHCPDTEQYLKILTSSLLRKERVHHSDKPLSHHRCRHPGIFRKTFSIWMDFILHSGMVHFSRRTRKSDIILFTGLTLP